jgi:SpoVK/Ycf46/Vps4 family AAA+-type ATPase
MSDQPTYEFYSRLARILNSGQSRSVVLSGNIGDLFWSGGDYVPLIPYLLEKTRPANYVQVVYEINGPLRIEEKSKAAIRQSWIDWKISMCPPAPNEKAQRTLYDNYYNQYDRHMDDAMQNSTVALEFLRQLCFCSRHTKKYSLLIVIEGGDMLLPVGKDDASLNDAQLRRIGIVQDWFSEPAFVNGKDSVVILAESRSMLNARVARMPQMATVDVESPTLATRQHYIENFLEERKLTEVKEIGGSVYLCPLPQSPVKNIASLAEGTAGLSIYALRQMLLGAIHSKDSLTNAAVIEKVEEYIQSQVGEDVVEFYRPTVKLDQIIGNRRLKEFIKRELIPRLKEKGKDALSGCAVSGPIGGGKSFLFDAVAGELDMPVLVMKNIRSQWFGQTDVIFERLKRAITAIEQVLIAVDEADTQFGGVDANAHETERRLTGKIQQMMSDPKLKGKVAWVLMTARIHLLSPDIRREGRAGDLIIPVLDPEGEDRTDFIKWALGEFAGMYYRPGEDSQNRPLWYILDERLPKSYSAAAFAALRSHLKIQQKLGTSIQKPERVLELVDDLLPSNIGLTREYQTLQALVNCTRRSLLPAGLGKALGKQSSFTVEEARNEWQARITQLEAQGIK